jgi:predicted ATPase
LHEQTAHAIEAIYHERLEEHYDALAHHYSRSGNTEKAIAYLQKAGQQAVQRSANTEAIRNFTTALEFLQAFPPTPAHLQQELTLQIALGVLFMAMKGFAAEEVRAAYSRAHELCLQVGDTAQLFRVLGGLWNCYALRGELRKSRDIVEQLLTLAAERGDTNVLVEAQRACAVTLIAQGEIVEAEDRLNQALSLATDQSRGIPPLLNGLDPVMGCLVQQARCLWLLGYADRASMKIHEGLRRAHDLNHPFSLAFALCMATGVAQYQRDGDKAQERAVALAELVNEHGFATFSAWSSCVGGWSRVHAAGKEIDLQLMQDGIIHYKAIGTENGLPYFLALLADAELYVGHIREGLAVVTEALAKATSTGERFWEAELYRLKGELTLQKGTRDWGLGAGSSSPQAPSLKPLVPMEVVEEAAGYFLKAIAVARQQQAKSLELRASMSLARLWQQQDKTAEAHSMLSEIYNWFTEGFETKDLQEAKTLIEELRQ